MSIVTIIETAKKIHKYDVILVKIGTFYRVYGKDSYIISYLFDYKLKEDNGIISCGFPEMALNKIIAKLEDEKINYIILDKRNNYEVDVVYDNKDLNTYQKAYEKSRKDASYLIKVDKICTYLKMNYKKSDCKKKILFMEEIMNEK